MGIIFSQRYYLSNPTQFATEASSELPEAGGRANGKSYDYIIVGAGACGAVLASRLSENRNVTVLLVEAGTNHEASPWASMPLAWAKHFGTKFVWGYHSTPQRSLNNREVFMPRGKMLGGCTSINAMMYHHCSPSDFDEWERLGAIGWSYKDLVPYFRKAEKFTPDPCCPGVKLEDRGTNGPWRTRFSHFAPIGAYFLEACREIGIPYNPDLNTPRGSIGAARITCFIDNKGQRSSSATAYLSRDVQARPNLTIAIETTTTRILCTKGTEPTAIGIEVAKQDSERRFRAFAAKEVILCAGAINTPQILNLSGIGAKEELDKFNIPLVKELPAVGKNLSEHLSSRIDLRAKKNTSLNWLANKFLLLCTILYWKVTGKGTATSNSAESAVFIRSTDATLLPSAEDVVDTTSGPNAPDLELIGVPLGFRDHGRTKPPPGTDTFVISPVLLRPLSTGSVYLSSSNPFCPPKIDPNFLAHPNDIKVLVRGMRITLRIARAAAFQPVLMLANRTTDKADPFWPGDVVPEEVEDADLEARIRATAQTMYHPVGTARIGRDEKDSVVDPELRVHGVRRLRIVDASIFPRQLSGHPTAPLIAIGEKAAEMIANGQAD